MSDAAEQPESHLPSVDKLVESVKPGLVRHAGRSFVVDTARGVLALARDHWKKTGAVTPLAELVQHTEGRVMQMLIPSLRNAVNATGIILHTGLGRAVLSAAAWNGVIGSALGHSTLEIDLETGERGSRQIHVAPILCALTGAEAAFVVNNDAGAVLLALAAVARGREVVVSRGELVEIGGGFRIPDVMLESGAILREVGTTNKTRLRDYASAITPNTAALMKVHPSNFKITGFTESVGIENLAGLARERGIPLLDDLGSGALVDIGFGEPTVQDRLSQGADLVMFSGDKLMGGPQAGIAVGRKDLIDKMAAHPLARALRCDKVTLALLENTLRLYQRGLAWDEIPTLRALATPPEECRVRAENLAEALNTLPGITSGVVPTIARVGAGALPQHELASFAATVECAGLGPNALSATLRAGPYAVVARVENDTVLLDVRTLRGIAEEVTILDALRTISERNKGE